jgi:hypothetical protein
MAFSMSIGEAREALSRARTAMTRVREKAEVAIGQGMEVAEVGGVAFGFGYANGRWGDPDTGEIKVLGLPVDLSVGIALTGVAMMGGFGKYGEHGVNIGAGALSAYAYRTGYQLGQTGAEDSASATTSARKISGARAARAVAGANGAARFATAGEWDGETYTVFDHAHHGG